MIRVELPFPVPIADCFTNAGKCGRVKTKRYEAYGLEAWASITKQKPGKAKGAVSVYIRVVAPDKRVRDGDNLLKCVFDTLKDNGIIADDSNRVVRRHTLEWAEDGPPCVVLIQAEERAVA
jgi:Holliday junction resolvase RusA-like endonuclease